MRQRGYQLMFTEDEISSEKLFDENVIVDLSVWVLVRPNPDNGSLILKCKNTEWFLVGVYESAAPPCDCFRRGHNLLKRTSTEQATESSNLLGKSVEMLTNAIE